MVIEQSFQIIFQKFAINSGKRRISQSVELLAPDSAHINIMLHKPGGQQSVGFQYNQRLPLSVEVKNSLNSPTEVISSNEILHTLHGTLLATMAVRYHFKKKICNLTVQHKAAIIKYSLSTAFRKHSENILCL